MVQSILIFDVHFLVCLGVMVRINDDVQIPDLIRAIPNNQNAVTSNSQ